MITTILNTLEITFILGVNVVSSQEIESFLMEWGVAVGLPNADPSRQKVLSFS